MGTLTRDINSTFKTPNNRPWKFSKWYKDANPGHENMGKIYVFKKWKSYKVKIGFETNNCGVPRSVSLKWYYDRQNFIIIILIIIFIANSLLSLSWLALRIFQLLYHPFNYHSQVTDVINYHLMK